MMALDTIWGMNSGSSLQHVHTTRQGHVVSLYCLLVLPARQACSSRGKQAVRAR